MVFKIAFSLLCLGSLALADTFPAPRVVGTPPADAGRGLVRVSETEIRHYESFSEDKGETWTEGQPSRFAATLTMPTLGRLPDGRLICLWTNQHPLPELHTAHGRSEDAFTNRDTIHGAISDDEGKTWRGFREIGLDPERNRSDYATWGGPQDRGHHQAEFVPLDEHRILVAYGQHKNHRRPPSSIPAGCWRNDASAISQMVPTTGSTTPLSPFRAATAPTTANPPPPWSPTPPNAMSMSSTSASSTTPNW